MALLPWIFSFIVLYPVVCGLVWGLWPRRHPCEQRDWPRAGWFGFLTLYPVLCLVALTPVAWEDLQAGRFRVHTFIADVWWLTKNELFPYFFGFSLVVYLLFYLHIGSILTMAAYAMGDSLRIRREGRLG